MWKKVGNGDWMYKFKARRRLSNRLATVMLRGTPCTLICEVFSLWAKFNEQPDIIEVVELHLRGSTMSDYSLNLYPELRALQTKMCASSQNKNQAVVANYSF